MDDQPNSEMSEIVEVLQSMYETDGLFYNTFRFLTPPTRNTALLVHQRINERTIALLNRLVTMHVPTRVVMNIPLSLNNAGTGNFWDPEVVRPTQQQIENGVERLVEVHDTTCSICQEPVVSASRIRHCGHSFHGNCINEWFEMNPRCPVCRYDVREYRRPASPISEHEI